MTYGQYAYDAFHSKLAENQRGDFEQLSSLARECWERAALAVRRAPELCCRTCPYLRFSHATKTSNNDLYCGHQASPQQPEDRIPLRIIDDNKTPSWCPLTR